MEGLNIEKKRIAIIGFGISGMSVARYFLNKNIQVDVYEDKKDADFPKDSLTQFTDNQNFKIFFSDTVGQIDIEKYDFVIASPGVPQTHRIVVQAKESNIEFVTDLNIFLRVFRTKYPAGKVISITGSNGKSTTVSMLLDVLLAAGEDAYLGGNIGTSPLDFFEHIKTDHPVIILETSSYQLEYITGKEYFDTACILNLSDNHLNRYGGKKELYAQAKLGGISSKETHVVVNFDDEYTRKYILPNLETKNVLGIQFENVVNEGVITFENDSLLYSSAEEKIVYLENVSKMKIKGTHNIYNTAFVCGVLYSLDIKPKDMIQKAIYDFAGLIHRVQFVDTINGVVYINDSKSTSPDATAKALDTIGASKNVILISGGNDKDISYDSMKEQWTDYVQGVVLLPGSANTKLKDLASRSGVEVLGEVQTMNEAMDIAVQNVSEGGTVLLSPATDSHASFKSFEDRGNQFIQCVQSLKG